GHKRISRFLARLPAAARSNADVLLAIDFVSAGGGVPARFKLGLPEDFPVRFVEGAELFVLGRPDKQKPASRDDGAADILRPGLRNPAGCQFLELPEKDLPGHLTFVEVNRGKLAPGRLNRRVAILGRDQRNRRPSPCRRRIRGKRLSPARWARGTGRRLAPS